MKIGILTHQYINNYGAFLQAWALRKAISELFPEDEVQIIDYVNVKHYIINAGGWFRFYKNRETLKEWFAKVHLPNTFAKARNQEMILSKRCFNARQINELAFDCIVVGSDEVWNYRDTKGNAELKFGVGLTCKNLIAYIRKAKTEMNRQLDSLNNLDVEHLPWIEDFKSYQNLTSLNRRVLVELVESITVYDKEHIHIQYRFDQEIRNVLEYCNSIPTAETEGSTV